MDTGRSLLTSERGESQLCAGDVVLIPPGHVHACNPLPSARWSYRMFYLEQSWMISALAAAGFGGGKTPHLYSLRTPTATAAVNRITDVLTTAKDGSGGERHLATAVRQLFSLSSHLFQSEHCLVPRSFSAMERVRDFIDQHCEERIHLAVLAKESGLSAFQLIRGFKRRFGLTPHAYQLNQRIVRARKLLVSGFALPEVAYALGFADQSHFQRVFKGQVAATPAQYQRSDAGAVARNLHCDRGRE